MATYLLSVRQAWLLEWGFYKEAGVYLNFEFEYYFRGKIFIQLRLLLLLLKIELLNIFS